MSELRESVISVREEASGGRVLKEGMPRTCLNCSRSSNTPACCLCNHIEKIARKAFVRIHNHGLKPISPNQGANVDILKRHD